MHVWHPFERFGDGLKKHPVVLDRLLLLVALLVFLEALVTMPGGGVFQVSNLFGCSIVETLVCSELLVVFCAIENDLLTYFW